MNDYLIISDLHLGARNSRTKKLRKLLEDIDSEKIKAREIILLGDVTDKKNIDRLRKKDWKVIDLLMSLNCTWVMGNHDPAFEIIHGVFGFDSVHSLQVKSGDKNIFMCHGHLYDQFIDKHPLITSIADSIYGVTQMLDPSHTLAKRLKKQSKMFLKCAKKIGIGVAATAKTLGCDIAIHGHNHNAGKSMIDGVEVWDTGCWTEKPSTYLTIQHGRVTINLI